MTRFSYGALFAALVACQPVATHAPVRADSEAVAPTAVMLATAAPTVKAAGVRPLSGCAAASERLRASLRVGITGVELRNALNDVDFVYREQRVMDNHHLTLPTDGEQAFQFGCVDEPVDKFDVELGEGVGPVPATRFFMRVAGADRAELKSFLASADGQLLQLAIVHDSAEERQRQMLQGLG